MIYILQVNDDYMDTSIGKYDKTLVEVLKLHEGTLKFSGSKGRKAEIVKEIDIEI